MTTSTTDNLNQALHDALIKHVGQARYRLWFGENTRLLLQDQVLVVEAATPFFQDWLRVNFRDALQQAAATVVGESVSIDFRINPELTKEPAQTSDEATGDEATPRVMRPPENG